jgi:NTE family protein
VDARSILAVAPLFAALSPDALDDLARLCVRFELRSGQPLFDQGDEPSHFYIIATGRLRITANGVVIGYVGHLEPVGEVGVIAGERRTASVHAIRDSVLLRFERNAFLVFLTMHPPALIMMSRVLVRRMAENQRAQKLASARGNRTLAVLAGSPGLDAEVFAEGLVAQLRNHHSTTRLVRAADVDAAVGPGASQAGFDGESDDRLTGWLNELEGQHRYIVYASGQNADAWALRCMHQADRVLVLGDAAAPDARSAMLDHLARSGVLAPVELVLMRRDGALAGDTLGWLTLTGARAHYFLRHDEAADLQSLARQLTGRGIGLVLGGGGARGFAHIGLIRALEELKIPVDVTGGTSMGAFIAALLACGFNSAEISRTCTETFVTNNYLNDYTLPRVALIRGRKFLARLHAIFGDRRIEDLRIPYFCVTTNLTRGTATVHDRGPLDIWLGTSMSVPGIAPPVAFQGDLLCDGGVINSLPTDVMQALERGPIIASDVSTEGDIKAPGAGMDGPDPNALLRWEGPGDPPGLRDILFRTATLTSESGVQRRAERADLYVRMPVTGVAMFDWKKLGELVERGYQHALAQLTPARDKLLS